MIATAPTVREYQRTGRSACSPKKQRGRRKIPKAKSARKKDNRCPTESEWRESDPATLANPCFARNHALAVTPTRVGVSQIRNDVRKRLRQSPPGCKSRLSCVEHLSVGVIPEPGTSIPGARRNMAGTETLGVTGAHPAPRRRSPYAGALPSPLVITLGSAMSAASSPRASAKKPRKTARTTPEAL